MGLLATDVQLFVSLARSGIPLGDLATLGRQTLHATPEDCRSALAGLPLDHAAVETFLAKRTEWAEDLFTLLGARSVTAIDFSDYEGASVLHDMNKPIDASLHQRFDTVHDGGTLEHVFNFPVGLANTMLMTRVGGRVIMHKPANNLCGHGFYQFSPELFYRVFSKENGFVVEAMAFAELFRGLKSNGPFYEVKDPQSTGLRVQLDSGAPVNLLVVARKIEHVEPFTTTPQQSDYVTAWTPGDQAGRAMRTSLKQRLIAHLDRTIPRAIQAARGIGNPFSRSSFYTKREALSFNAKS